MNTFSLNLKTKTHITQLNSDLTQDLASYGLKPTEWNLKLKSQDKLLISNKYEPNFCFGGNYTFSKNKFTWKKIQLISL